MRNRCFVSKSFCVPLLAFQWSLFSHLPLEELLEAHKIFTSRTIVISSVRHSYHKYISPLHKKIMYGMNDDTMAKQGCHNNESASSSSFPLNAWRLRTLSDKMQNRDNFVTRVLEEALELAAELESLELDYADDHDDDDDEGLLSGRVQEEEQQQQRIQQAAAKTSSTKENKSSS